MDLLEAAPAFVLSLELGGFVLRCNDLLALVGNNQCITVCSLYRGCPYFRESV